MAKLNRINQEATVTGRGSRLVGCMSSETPYYQFATDDGDNFVWVSDNAGWINLRKGDRVQLAAFIAPDKYTDRSGARHLRRVQVTRV